MYEAHLFNKPYQDKNKFKHSWDIPKFIQSGNRLDKLDNMTDEMWEIIEGCWQQNPRERLTIKEINLDNL